MTTARAGGLPERWDAVLEHRERAIRVARARLSNPYDVDDCVQEGMARVVAMPNLDLDRVGPLLSTVVANVATDTHRKHSRSSRLEARLTSSEVAAQVHDEPVCDAAEARWLHAQLELLAPRERAVLELRAEGRTVAQTAAALGITYKAVECAFTRGRTALKILWRATLAALAGTAVRTFRVPPKAASTAVLAAAATLAICVLPLIPASPDHDSLTQLSPGPRTVDTATAPHFRAAAVVSRATSTRTRKPPTALLPAKESTLAAVNPPDTSRVTPTNVSVTKDHDNESFTETVQRCLHNGLTISPSKIRCRR